MRPHFLMAFSLAFKFVFPDLHSQSIVEKEIISGPISCETPASRFRENWINLILREDSRKMRQHLNFPQCNRFVCSFVSLRLYILLFLDCSSVMGCLWQRSFLLVYEWGSSVQYTIMESTLTGVSIVPFKLSCTRDKISTPNTVEWGMM